MSRGQEHDGELPMVAVSIHVRGKRPVTELADALTGFDLVDTVVATTPAGG